MISMVFRDYRTGDFEQLFRLWEELDMGGSERGDTHEVILRTLEHGGKLILLVDEANGSIIGSSWLTYDGRRMFLHHFGIRKAHQGKGWGTKLAMESLKYIREKNCQVKLEVHKDNLPAKRLYEKVGFGAFTDFDIYMIRNPHKPNSR
jgi:ribosomal protein S18 acetylase RimI-like enzyme